MPLTYSEYLHLDKLLGAQEPKSDHEHDELLFIIIHQVYELWFKQVLHEGTHLQASLSEGKIYPALATLQRMTKILKTMVSQTDVLETMTPVSFSSFRDRLESASGFQSGQYRIFEFFMGNRNTDRVGIHPEGSEVRKRLEAMLGEPTLYDSFLRFLADSGRDVPENVIDRDLSKPYEGDAKVREILIDIYHNDPMLAQVCEALVDLDEGIQEWRYRHVKMVERTIGNRKGTGGSSGVDFLKNTLFRPAFEDLWAIRSDL